MEFSVLRGGRVIGRIFWCAAYLILGVVCLVFAALPYGDDKIVRQTALYLLPEGFWFYVLFLGFSVLPIAPLYLLARWRLRKFGPWGLRHAKIPALLLILCALSFWAKPLYVSAIIHSMSGCGVPPDADIPLRCSFVKGIAPAYVAFGWAGLLLWWISVVAILKTAVSLLYVPRRIAQDALPDYFA